MFRAFICAGLVLLAIIAPLCDAYKIPAPVISILSVGLKVSIEGKWDLIYNLVYKDLDNLYTNIMLSLAR